MAAPVSALQRHRFELFHGSLVICGIWIAVGSLFELSTASAPTGVSFFDALGVVTGVGFVGWGCWEARHRPREEWERDVEGYGLAIWTVIGVATVVVVLAVYEVLSAT